MALKRSAIIIGSGVAGLASAIRLAARNFEVTVFEKNSYPGGKLTHFEKNGFHFDAGPSLFTQPENIAELFEIAGEPLHEYFSYQRVETTCKYFYPNGVVINAFADVDLFAKEIEEKTGDKAEKVIAYLKRSAALYNNTATIFLDYSLHKLSTLFKAPILRAIAHTRAGYLTSSLNTLNAGYFKSAETIQLFNRYATYNGSNPYKAPGMLSVIPHLELNLGTYYPAGGMKSITGALYTLAEKLGVNVVFETQVEEILTTNKQVSGVMANGKFYPCDVVVSNMDVYFTFKNLLHNQRRADKIARQERSSSAVIFYWGINRSFPQLELHNLFFSGDYQKEFEAIFDNQVICDDPTVYVNITSKMEQGHAPEGKENWFVMINAPSVSGQNWDDLKQQCRQAVIKKLSTLLKTDIESAIEVEETLDPVKIAQQTSAYLGALYGTSSNSKMAAFLRPPNFSKSVKGLYFAGGTVHPGGGIPLCLKSAKLATDMILSDLPTR